MRHWEFSPSLPAGAGAWALSAVLKRCVGRSAAQYQPEHAQMSKPAPINPQVAARHISSTVLKMKLANKIMLKAKQNKAKQQKLPTSPHLGLCWFLQI